MFAPAPGHTSSWARVRPAVLMLLVCSCSCTPAPAAQHSFSRASSSKSGQGSQEGGGDKNGAGGVTGASVGRANSFPTAFVRTRVGVKRKSISGGDTKANSIGSARTHWAVAGREDMAGSRLPP
eukprot:CAMPEP_0173453190 /NCGR_PEP_ID=MMETSP1357-20121228/50150_1 /TAXON_ID=77926 /ORGANISM="Hemiselmis rufescens, Strain PCC563" /LENGTH=123 /DNA_ID=CAMNT_0014420131 /DNA_START=81 /DNA_END=449 /DNA_ORIENTATION=+